MAANTISSHVGTVSAKYAASNMDGGVRVGQAQSMGLTALLTRNRLPAAAIRWMLSISATNVPYLPGARRPGHHKVLYQGDPKALQAGVQANPL